MTLVIETRIAQISSVYVSFIHSISKISNATFRHPILTDDDKFYGTRLGFDSWADTSCAGRHAFVDSFVEGKSVNATGFSGTLGSINDLPIANVIYAFDQPDGETILLENFNAIYLGEKMEDSLINPIQCEENNVKIDMRPKHFYPNQSNCQSVTFDDGTQIPLEFDGVLPYLRVRRPTNKELDSCKRLQLTSEGEWNPNDFNGILSSMQHEQSQDDINGNHHDPTSKQLLHSNLASILAAQPMLYPNNETYSTLSAIKSVSKNTITPEALSKLWGIGLKTASRTLKSTTHKCIRSTGLLSKRFKTDKAQLRYKQLQRQFGTFYVDYLKVNVKSVRGYIGGSVYTNKLGFKKFYPHSDEKGQSTAAGFRNFIDIIGLPFSIHADNHSNYREGAFRKLLRKFGIKQTFTEPHSPWQNRAEYAIGEIKAHARRLMQRTNTPIRLWCYCYEYTADILSLCATGRYDLKGRTPYEAVLNYTPDISEFVTFGWFQWCYYFNESTKSKSLCRWIGPANGIGQSFCSYLLIENGTVITRSSVLPIPEEELETTTVKENCVKFMLSVEDKIGNHKVPCFDSDNPRSIYYQPFDCDESDDDVILPYGEEILDNKLEEIDMPYLEQLDNYIGTHVVIPGVTDGVEPVLAVIKGRKRDHEGNPIGVSNPNPILDTRVYELQFPDGRVEDYSMNIIVENLLAQVDEFGNDMGIFKEIIDYRCDESIAIPKGESAFTEINGRLKPIITTKGWDLRVKWTDGSTSWLPLRIMKESYPVETAEFAFANTLQDEPAFHWWIKPVLKKRDYIINKVKTNKSHRKGNMKFGVRIPQSVEEALELDRQNGNNLWAEAIDKEMKNSRIAFEVLDKYTPPPPGYKKITCHMNFEVKMDLRRKARYVAGGHLTDPPTSMTYSTVVSRESVRIAFLIAALNNFNILAGDIQNAYLNASTSEKLYFIAGKEWKADEGKPILIVRALYGLKSSALQWRNHLADTLGNTLGFKSSLADPDVWMKDMIDSEGNEYYAYILVYVDDILVLDYKPQLHMAKLKETFTVRDETIKEPDKYLGADIGKVHFEDGTHAWTMASKSYVKNVVKNIKARLQEDGYKFNSKLSSLSYSAKQPFSTIDYRPELDTSYECNPDQTQFYQNLMGILRWLVELGRIDIAYETSVLSSYNANPRTGHLTQALHIIKYLDIHCENEITFDPEEYIMTATELEEAESKWKAMAQLYPDAKEELPHNAPKAKGAPVQMNCFVDSDHAGDRKTRRSHTGIIIYLNKAPIIWYSKKQSTVESSTFGSEFVALRVAAEQIISLRYKLRMMGVPINGYTNIFCDNESVFKNASIAESRLTKKHNSICFHRVRECVASQIIMPFKVDSQYNLADLLTKSLPSFKRLALRKLIMPEHH